VAPEPDPAVNASAAETRTKSEPAFLRRVAARPGRGI
jgi:hypothetical protein